MPYNEKIADRVREIIASATDKVEEKKMFGGLCFMVDDKMCVGVKADRIMVRISPALGGQRQSALALGLRDIMLKTI